MLLFLECAGVYRSQGKTSAALRCPRTGPRCPTAQRTSISVPAGDTSTSAETRSLQDESSDLPGFLSQYISLVRAKSGHFKPTTSCEDQVRQPSLCVGQAGQDGHGRVPQAAPPVPIWWLQSLGCWLAHWPAFSLALWMTGLQATSPSPGRVRWASTSVVTTGRVWKGDLDIRASQRQKGVHHGWGSGYRMVWGGQGKRLIHQPRTSGVLPDHSFPSPVGTKGCDQLRCHDCSCCVIRPSEVHKA